MTEDTALLIDRVSELLGDSGGDVERTLTDGYAGAQDSERLDELSSLGHRISRTDEELSQLRAVLARVRERLTAAGIALAVSR